MISLIAMLVVAAIGGTLAFLAGKDAPDGLGGYP